MSAQCPRISVIITRVIERRLPFRLGLQPLGNFLRRNRTGCKKTAAALAISGSLIWGAEAITHLPPPQAHVELVASSPLLPAADGAGWVESATVEVAYTGDSPAPVTIGVQRDTQWNAPNADKGYDGTNPARIGSGEIDDVWQGAQVTSVSGATLIGNNSADLGVMHQGEDRRVTITYRVTQSDKQRAKADVTWWNSHGYYNAVDPVTAKAVVTLGSSQQETNTWTELES